MISAERAGLLADRMKALAFALWFGLAGFLSWPLLSEEVTYELSSGHYVALHGWLGSCSNLQDALKRGATVQTKAPWGTTYDVVHVYCRERVIP